MPRTDSRDRRREENRARNEQAAQAVTTPTVSIAPTLDENGLINGKAADTYAQVTREQYQNWYDTFYPKQKQLLEQTQSGELLKQQLGRVDSNMNSSMRAAQQAQINQMARYGVQAEADPNRAAQQALSKVTAKNSLREYEQDRALNVLAGTSSKSMQEMVV